MARPKRTTEQEFFDVFADWEVADQAAALRVMEALHRQAKRVQRAPSSMRVLAPEDTYALTGPGGDDASE